MASRAFATSALLITLNLLFFTMVTCCVPCQQPPSPTIHKPPPTHPKSPPTPAKPKSPPPAPKPKSPPPAPISKPPPSPSKEDCPPPSVPLPTPPSPPKATCPRDTLKLAACGNLLNDLVHIVIGTTPSKTECCGLIGGLTDLDAAVCLCTAIKANVLGINLNVPVSLSLLLNYCGKKVPSGFQCA